MNHIAFNPRGPKVELEADYVVVGSGAGGATAAVELARGGADVLLVEAGPWRMPGDYPHSMYGWMRDMVADWNTTIALGRAFWPVVQAKVVGGTTSINSAIAVRTPGDIFPLWQREHGIFHDGEGQALWRHQDAIEEELHVSVTPPPSMGRSNDLAEQGARSVGYHDHAMLRYAKDCAGSGQCLQGCREDRKQSLNVTYVPEMIRLGGHLMSCAPVKRVLFEGSRATGVTGRFVHPLTRRKGAHFHVRAKRAVIVAASVLHSPLLLKRSGIRSRMLGRAFQAHPGTGVFGVYDDPVYLNTGATQGWSSTKFREDEGFKLETLSIPLELIAGRLKGSGTSLMERIGRYPHLAMWVAAIRAETHGRVRASITGKPIIHYRACRADMIRLRQGLFRVAEMHVAAGATKIIPGIVGLPFELEPTEIHRIADGPLDPRAYIALLTHLFGGCIMGADPAKSVCDGDGVVHHTDNLLIADASCIPTTIGVNPQHTIMSIAKLRAEQLLNQRN